MMLDILHPFEIGFFDIMNFAVHVGLPHFLLLSAVLFAIGLFGLMTKRGIIPALMSIELMLNSVNINLVAFNRYMPMPDYAGQLMAVFAIAVGACEVAVGVALAFRIYSDRKTVNIDDLNSMKG